MKEFGHRRSGCRHGRVGSPRRTQDKGSPGPRTEVRPLSGSSGHRGPFSTSDRISIYVASHKTTLPDGRSPELPRYWNGPWEPRTRHPQLLPVQVGRPSGPPKENMREVGFFRRPVSSSSCGPDRSPGSLVPLHDCHRGGYVCVCVFTPPLPGTRDRGSPVETNGSVRRRSDWYPSSEAVPPPSITLVM